MNGKADNDFYRDLPVTDRFFGMLDPRNRYALPESWYIGVTDIEDSTDAVSNGRFREVNILGASPIVGMLNAAGRDRLPYTFCGDGAVICIPPDLISHAKNTLYRCRGVGREQYGLDLRAALVPVSYIRRQGVEVNVTRYRVSEQYDQALFSGGGVRRAEQLLKNSKIPQYEISEPELREPVDFSGLECRWKRVGKGGKEVMTLLVWANPAASGADRTYRQVLEKLQELFEFDAGANPVNAGALRMYLSIPALMGEIRFHTFEKSLYRRLAYLLKVELEVVLGKILMRFGIKTSQTDWGRYRSDLVKNSDFRKFDDMLRTVISGPVHRRRKLELFLQQKFESRELAYGLDVSSAATVTCMVFRRQSEHIHFVDGAGGGYVRASRALKRRMENFKLN